MQHELELYRQFVYRAHDEVNQKYDKLLPYAFHLKMVEAEGEQFIHLLETDLQMECRFGFTGHDLFENTNITYNQCYKFLTKTLKMQARPSKSICEIQYACWDEKGRTREEKHNLKYWETLRNTPGGPFTKCADRLGNVKYGVFNNGHMVDTYRKEQPDFIENIGHLIPAPMLERLNHLLTIKI